MARTGSGKSLAYLVPLVQRLGGRHSTTFGARALILLPARELALQIMKVGKELARGYHAGEGDHAGDGKYNGDSAKGQSLRWGLVVGGEGLDEQFEMISNNPDVYVCFTFTLKPDLAFRSIIATPGRLLHLIVEMNLDLKSVQYVVFDEADRLFEMGFETAMTEILHRLPANRQTLLFSATLPKSLVEFAKAGLQNPKLVRLDAESKISTDLRMSFFSIKQAEKDACLLILLRDVIGVPLGSNKKEPEEGGDKKGKGKAKAKYSDYVTAPHQTLIFAATKHHVEYLMNLLTTAGYAVSHIYGSLDQVARTQQMDHFRKGYTNILVVTDVAARGIDIPVLENVVNYDFPQGARVFVHRVGRTARAGRQGWAWSFVTNTELPYLLDLQLFLGRPIASDVSQEGDQPYTESLVIGPFDRDRVDGEVEYVRKLDEDNHNLVALRELMRKGHSMYERSKGKASQASYNRAKTMMKGDRSGLVGATSTPHPVLLRSKDGASITKKLEEEKRRKELLMAVNAFRPNETVLEIGARGNAETAALMKQRRKALSKAAQRAQTASTSAAVVEDDERESDIEADVGGEAEMANEEEIAVGVTALCRRGPGLIHSYRPCLNPVRRVRTRRETIVIQNNTCRITKRAQIPRKGKLEAEMNWLCIRAEFSFRYSLNDGASFAEQARGVTFDLAGDEALQERKRRELRWDKTKKKFVKGTGEGADNVKLVKTESGVKLPATYRSGRFDEWKAKSRVTIPRIGETEGQSTQRRGAFGAGGRKYKHNQVAEAKPLDKFHKSYEKKIRLQKKKQTDGAVDVESTHAGNGKKLGGRLGGKSVGRVKNELKTVDQIRRARLMSEKKKAKNARPTHKGKRGKR